MNCEFCNLTNDEEKYLLSESEYWKVFLADNQNYIGRCIISSKSHIESIGELSDEQWLELKSVIARLQNTVKNTLNASHFNIVCLMNNAFKSDTPSPHMHFHLIPRYKSSVVVNNNTYYDSEFGHHYNSKKENMMKQTDIETLFKILYNELN